VIFKKKDNRSKYEALLCIPEKNSLVKKSILDSGDMILSYQSMYRPFFRKIQKLIRKSPDNTFIRKVQLDLLGVDIWSLIDGKNNVQTIIKKFAGLHTLNYKEAEISVTLFLRSLGKKGLISIKEP